MGDLANTTQLTGLNVVSLIALIIKEVSNAQMHKRNFCQFSRHLMLIGNLLEQLKITELKRRIMLNLKERKNDLEDFKLKLKNVLKEKSDLDCLVQPSCKDLIRLSDIFRSQ